MRAQLQRLQRWIPNALTLLAGIVALVGIGCIASAPGVAVALLVLGQALDILDGAAARRFNAVTDFGARLDWSLDVAVVHVLLVTLGLVWLVPVFSALQAHSLVHRQRISGRSAIVVGAGLHLLGVL